MIRKQNCLNNENDHIVQHYLLQYVIIIMAYFMNIHEYLQPLVSLLMVIITQN
jgi:hypothetical protein